MARQQAREREALEPTAEVPPWLEPDRAALKGIVRRLPQRADLQAPFDQTQIIEFCSR
jgi:hypothetical protein